MRQVTKTEQEKAEIEAAERKDFRKGGFDIMHDRDRSWGRIRNYEGGEVVMEWHVDSPLEEGVPRNNLPDGMFRLIANGQSIIMEKEEFMRLLRWV